MKLLNKNNNTALFAISFGAIYLCLSSFLLPIVIFKLYIWKDWKYWYPLIGIFLEFWIEFIPTLFKFLGKWKHIAYSYIAEVWVVISIIIGLALIIDDKNDSIHYYPTSITKIPSILIYIKLHISFF